MCREEEREVVKTTAKRSTRRGDDYKVRWEGTWKPESELGNAQRLIQEFEGRDDGRSVEDTVSDGLKRAGMGER